MDRGTKGLKFSSPLEPAELNKLLGNIMISHRSGMSYEDTKKVLNQKHDIQRSPSVFTNIHHSFWEVLNEDLQQGSANMFLAVGLLADIRTRIISLLTPTTLGLREVIDSLLDQEKINSEATNKKLKLKTYATGILHILERICTPRREKEIRNLLRENNLLVLYKGIINVTDKMKVDQKKYGVVLASPPVDSDDEETVDKVADYMYHLGGELPNTESWLKKHFTRSSHPKDIIHRAFVGLLASGPEPYPETLMMHIPKLESLKREYFQLVIGVSVVLTSLTYLPPAMCTTEAREECFALIMNLLKGVKSDSDLTRVLPTIVDKIRINAMRKLREMNNTSLTESLMKTLSYQLQQIPDSKNKVRRSVTQRVQEYLRQSLVTEGAAPVPENLHFIAYQLTELSTRLNLVVISNIDKCLSFYEKIIGDLRMKSNKLDIEAERLKNQRQFKYVRTRLL